MKKYTLSIIILIFSGFGLQIFSQGISTQGTDFWVSYGSNSGKTTSEINLQIRIVTSKATTVTFTYTATGTTYSIDLAEGSVYSRNLTDSEKISVYSSTTGSTNNSLHIQTTEPVSVYALNQSAATTDATNVLPTNNLGTEYFHISYTPLTSSARQDGYTIVAINDGTTIYEGGVLKATINRGQVYSNYFSLDGTGKHITSNNPIAYFVTISGTNIPIGVSYSDCMYQQLAPVNKWGTNFLVPVSRKGVERVRIVASQDGTTITQTGGVIKLDGGTNAKNSLNLDKGEFVELEIKLASAGCFISADKPVGVCSFMTGGQYSGGTTSGGDPALAWVPPIEQSISGALITPFIPSGTTQLNAHYALIVTEAATKDDTRMAIGTGEAVALEGGTWTVNSTSGYAFYSIQLSNSSYYFTNPSGLTVMGYGQGSAESYYYLSGAAARNLDAAFYVNDIHYQDIDGSLFCGESLFNFRAAIKYAMSNTPGYLKWYINGVEEVSVRDNLTWSKNLPPAEYTIRMEVLDMQNVTHVMESNFIIASRPNIGPINDISACLGEYVPDILLNGSSNQIIYEWSSGSSTGLTDGIGFNEIPGFYAIGSGLVTVTPSIVAGNSECIGTPSSFNIYTTIPSTGSISSGEYLWTGGSLQNDSWNNVDNWVVYDGNSYNLVSSTPLTSTNVRIMSYGGCIYDPNIHSDASSVCRNLTITNTNLILNNSILNVYGSWLNEGVYTPDINTTIIFTGNVLNRTIKSGGSDFSNIKFDFSGDIHLSDKMGIKGKGEFENGIVYGDVIFRENSASSVSSSSISFVRGSVTKLGYGNFVFPLGDVSVRTFYEGYENIEYRVLGLLSMSPASSSNPPEVKVSYYFDNTDLPSWWSTSNNLSPELHHVSDREYWKVESNCPMNNLSLYWYNNDNCIRNNLAEVCMHGFCTHENIGDIDLSMMSIAVSDGGIWRSLNSTGVGGHVTGNISSNEELSFDGGAKSAGSMFVSFGSSDAAVPLPVELLEFRVKAYEKTIGLDWITLSEINNDYFEVERSNDAHNFEGIAIVRGGGFSSRMLSYHYEDSDVDFGETYYYRLKQVDYDNSYEYSPVKSAKIESVDASLSLYPNPADDYLVLIIDKEEFVYEILNSFGQIILNGSNTKNINIAGLASGIYITKVLIGDEIYYERFIKE